MNGEVEEAVPDGKAVRMVPGGVQRTEHVLERHFVQLEGLSLPEWEFGLHHSWIVVQRFAVPVVREV